MSLAQIERACEVAFSGTDLHERRSAEQFLASTFPTFFDVAAGIGDTSPIHATADAAQSPNDTVAKLSFLLERTSSPWTQLFSSQILLKLVGDHWAILQPEQKLSLRNLVLTYMYQHPTLPNYVLNAFIKLMCQITRLGWLDDDAFKEIVSDARNFLQGSTELSVTGLTLLSQFVGEMSVPPSQPQRSLLRHRKTAVSFRDSHLFEVFQMSMTMLRSLVERKVAFSNNSQEARMKESCLLLVKNCLNFDFIGTNSEESEESTGSVQIPGSWRIFICDPTTLQVLFDAFETFDPPLTGQVLDALSLLVSTRKSLFSEEEKKGFLTHILKGTLGIMTHSRRHLADETTFHEFCRCIARLKSVYQLSEVSESEDAMAWLDQVAQITDSAFGPNGAAHNCVGYLMSFWSRMTVLTTSVRPKIVERVKELCVQLVQTFVGARLENPPPNPGSAALVSVDESVAMDGSDETELGTPAEEGEDSVLLEQLASIARFSYSSTTAYLISCVDLLSSGQIAQPPDPQRARIVGEARTAWLINVAAAFVSARTPYYSADEDDMLDGELSSKVLNLLKLSESAPPSARLDLSFASFFQAFKKSYIGDQAQRATKLYAKLAESCGLTDQNAVLDVIVRKLISNLQTWSKKQSIMHTSIKLFADLTTGYSSVKMLRKLDMTAVVIQHHSQFPFLQAPSNSGFAKRNRNLFYSALSRLLFAGDDVTEAEVFTFMSPWGQRLDRLGQLNAVELRREDVKIVMDGLFRDMRGFLMPLQNRRQYTMFFDWFLPYMPVLLRALEANHDTFVAIAILKFFGEFVANKQQRLNFDVSSPNGILLFRETSRVLQTYGRFVIGRNVGEARKYEDKFKGISACFSIMRLSIAGRYVPFGVFDLYNDSALEIAVDVIINMMLEVPLEDILAFPKLTTAFFSFLDNFTTELIFSLKSLPDGAFLYIMRACIEGLRSLQANTSSEAALTLDHIVTFLFTSTTSGHMPRIAKPPEQHFIVRSAKEYSDVLPLIMAQTLQLLILDDTSNQWSLSRPLLGLVLLCKSAFIDFTRKFISVQYPERQETLSKAITQLMEGIEDSLSMKNRDKFTQQIMTMRRAVEKEKFVEVPLPSTPWT
ncbi:hypothetical protein M427DRAFT_54487 [Gonapodya prolifera JEL478]|uniref:Uncharacterized protein n=1 Tax=Gonapodya prolifera (strain JEL478) TaxID=1344416 RepID=A0A139AL82_GONPJ|nr:hypothetical protein M427DRAFT_54487 [Gonapodya prolifera JEL478]|eukprot:KXS17551.1 hypothetical protein M427DRAFT_54487 [Gonapodya prolifera JEL478]